MRRRHGILVACVLIVLALTLPGLHAAQGQTDQRIALAFVWRDTLTLADTDGNALSQPGPAFDYGVGARLFWTADAETLYIARSDGLFKAGLSGGPAVMIPGNYGRTLTISQDAALLFYLDTTEPTAVQNDAAPADGDDVDAPQQVAFPLREVVLHDTGGLGRFDGYFGQFDATSAVADIAFAAALYARDGGLLGPGRPHLWPTYGSNVFGTCCFPEPGLGMLDLRTAQFAIFDAEFIPGAAALNLTRTHLAGPTTTGALRVIDLITGGVRDYALDTAGTVERVAWSPDDTYLYISTRTAPTTPLLLTTETAFPADLHSADVAVYRLNLVTSEVRVLARRADVFGISSLAATNRYVFATVVDPNVALVQALNARQVRPGSNPTNPELAPLWPATHLWRIATDGSGDGDVLDDVWGVVARPVR